MYARQTTYVDSRATAYRVMDDSVLSVNKKASSLSVGMANGEVVRAESEGVFVFQLSAGTEQVRQDQGLCILRIVHKLVSVADMCDDGHTGQFNQIRFFSKMKGIL